MAEQTQERSDEGNYRLPGDTTLKHVAKLGIVEDGVYKNGVPVNKSKVYTNSAYDLENSNLEPKIFDIIFLDPPFRDKEVKDLIDQIKKVRITNLQTLLIIHRNKKSDDKISQFLNVLEEKNYGLSKIFFCKIN